MIYWPTKSPTTVIDLGAEWGPALAKLDDPTIVSSIWSLETGDIVLGASSITGSKTAVRVSDGTDGTYAVAKNIVNLSDGSTLDDKALIKIRA